jgi:hypothetical protein
MKSRVRRALAAYGAGPVELVAVPLCLVITAYVVLTRFHGIQHTHRMAVWFIAAILLNDAFLFPLYTALDRGWQLLAAHGPRGVPLVNFVRVPTAFSLLLFLIFLPSIWGQGQDAYFAASGLGAGKYVQHWLLISAVMFATSAVLYVSRVLWVGRKGR